MPADFFFLPLSLTLHRRRSNGHPKHRRTGACINPSHYTPLDYAPLILALESALIALKVTTQDQHLDSLLARSRDASTDDSESLFRGLCMHLRSFSFVSSATALAATH
jgi:hypothetical protein